MSNIGGKPLDTLVNGVWVRQADVVTEAQLETDGGGNPVSIKSVNGGPSIPLLARMNNIIGLKQCGLNTNTGSTAGRTFLSKIAAPCEFDAVRLVIYHHEASATTAYTACVAATETAEKTDMGVTGVKLYRPQVGGTEQSALDSTLDQYGWRSAKFSGAASFAPAAGAATAPVVFKSDWIELSSVPRADGGTLPLLMTRINVTGGTSSFYGTSAAAEAATAANGGFLSQGLFVSDPSGLLVSAPAANNPSVTVLNQTHMTVGFEFRSRKRGITILGIGDSITQNMTVVADKVSSIGLRAAAQLSANGIPCGYINHGQASYDMDYFWTTNGKPAFTNWSPNVAFIAGFTPNYGPYSSAGVMRYSIQRQRAMVADFRATCEANRVACLVATGVACSAVTVATEAVDSIRRQYVENIKAGGYGYIALDWDSLVTDEATPARIKAEYQYDATHPNEAAVQLQADQLVANIKLLLGL